MVLLVGRILLYGAVALTPRPAISPAAPAQVPVPATLRPERRSLAGGDAEGEVDAEQCAPEPHHVAPLLLSKLCCQGLHQHSGRVVCDMYS